MPLNQVRGGLPALPNGPYRLRIADVQRFMEIMRTITADPLTLTVTDKRRREFECDSAADLSGLPGKAVMVNITGDFVPALRIAHSVAWLTAGKIPSPQAVLAAEQIGYLLRKRRVIHWRAIFGTLALAFGFAIGAAIARDDARTALLAVSWFLSLTAFIRSAVDLIRERRGLLVRDSTGDSWWHRNEVVGTWVGVLLGAVGVGLTVWTLVPH